MNWKRILTISLLTLSLAACEDDQTSPKKEPSIIYEVNEQMMANSDSGVGEEVPELESNQEKVSFYGQVTVILRYLKGLTIARGVSGSK